MRHYRNLLFQPYNSVELMQLIHPTLTILGNQNSYDLSNMAYDPIN